LSLVLQLKRALVNSAERTSLFSWTMFEFGPPVEKGTCTQRKKNRAYFSWTTFDFSPPAEKGTCTQRKKNRAYFSWTMFDFGPPAEKGTCTQRKKNELIFLGQCLILVLQLKRAPVHSAKRMSLFSWTMFDFGPPAEKGTCTQRKKNELNFLGQCLILVLQLKRAPVHSAKRTS